MARGACRLVFRSFPTPESTTQHPNASRRSTSLATSHPILTIRLNRQVRFVFFPDYCYLCTHSFLCHFLDCRFRVKPTAHSRTSYIQTPLPMMPPLTARDASSLSQRQSEDPDASRPPRRNDEYARLGRASITSLVSAANRDQKFAAQFANSLQFTVINPKTQQMNMQWYNYYKAVLQTYDKSAKLVCPFLSTSPY